MSATPIKIATRVAAQPRLLCLLAALCVSVALLAAPSPLRSQQGVAMNCPATFCVSLPLVGLAPPVVVERISFPGFYKYSTRVSAIVAAVRNVSEGTYYGLVLEVAVDLGGTPETVYLSSSFPALLPGQYLLLRGWLKNERGVSYWDARPIAAKVLTYRLGDRPQSSALTVVDVRFCEDGYGGIEVDLRNDTEWTMRELWVSIWFSHNYSPVQEITTALTLKPGDVTTLRFPFFPYDNIYEPYPCTLKDSPQKPSGPGYTEPIDVFAQGRHDT